MKRLKPILLSTKMTTKITDPSRIKPLHRTGTMQRIDLKTTSKLPTLKPNRNLFAVYIGKATTLTYMQNFKKAAEHFSNIIKSQPGNKEAKERLYALGRRAVHANQIDQAIEILSDLYAIVPDEKVRVALTNCCIEKAGDCLRAEQYTEAVHYCNTILKLSPKHFMALHFKDEAEDEMYKNIFGSAPVKSNSYEDEDDDEEDYSSSWQRY